MSYNICVEGFEGPFDLLLHLIQINEVDIYDIPICEVTNQYLAHLDCMAEMDMEITSSFLVMAATLIELKSKMLLPQNDYVSGEDGAQGNDPRTDLVVKLLAYKKYKNAATYFQDRESIYAKAVAKSQGDLEPFVAGEDNEKLNKGLEQDILLEALKRVLIHIDKKDRHRDGFFQSLKRDLYTVEEKMEAILFCVKGRKELFFESLFKGEITKNEVIVTFLAVLELLKQGHILVRQTHVFEPIVILDCTEQGREEIGA